MSNQHAWIRMIVYFVKYGFLYQTIPCSFHLTCSKDQKLDSTNLKD